ncbi:VrrA/YqfQ family protein [Solibacillus daqui]|uniref:VrrA/YqfQ family protein n=1 Tax=Solibacillus daqui TaxID=2912187 RepID=UPI002365D666|nr:VrrA/YqfQ family protein [Solibacillus daqui]
MRRPFYMPPGGMMPQMPVTPRFPMYAPYMMNMPMNARMPMNTMPMNAMPMNSMPMNSMPPMPPQMPVANAAAGTPRLEGFLSGANSLFENAQKFTPYIQQATPMLKNLPALWRMYRGFKSSPDILESSTIVAPVEQPPRQQRGSRQPQQPNEPRTPKPSLPKIFQPPLE